MYAYDLKKVKQDLYLIAAPIADVTFMEMWCIQAWAVLEVTRSISERGFSE